MGNGGVDEGLPRAQEHAAHGALHRAVTRSLQGLLALEVALPIYILRRTNGIPMIRIESQTRDKIYHSVVCFMGSPHQVSQVKRVTPRYGGVGGHGLLWGQSDC